MTDWYEQRTRYVRQLREKALEAGRDAWNEATRTGRNVVARTEAELETLGRQALAQGAATRKAAQGAVATVRSGVRAANEAQATRARAERAAVQQTPQMLGRVKSALVDDHPPKKWTQDGAVDLKLVDSRMAETERNVRRYADAAARSGDLTVMAGAWPVAAGQWLADVQPGGRWDDKGPNGEHLEARERQGNFNYGATAAALGLPLEAALWGAGTVQRLQNVGRAIEGSPFAPSVGGSYYGDDPRDQRVIREGYDYGVRSRWRGGQ